VVVTNRKQRFGHGGLPFSNRCASRVATAALPLASLAAGLASRLSFGGREELEFGLGLAFAEAAEGDQGSELFFAGAGLVLLPVVDRQRRDADKFGVVGGGEAGALALSCNGAGREASLTIQLCAGRGGLQGFAGLGCEERNLLFVFALLAFQPGDFAAVLGDCPGDVASLSLDLSSLAGVRRCRSV
jgi:hypothetical protein